MTRARKHLVCAADTPYYHITSRCVRRAFLCGEDRYSGRSYEHRRDWIEARTRLLSSLFCIDVCAYAVMSNHYHLVVKLDPEQASHWSDDEVLRRWTSLFKGTLLVQRHLAEAHLSLAEQNTLRSTMLIYRQRLTSLSWFMKCLNEPIARKANAEDGCSGHFWEARFHSQALLTERALLCAMAYVDLNPVRAGIAKNPEDSKYTSYRARMTAIDNQELKQAIAEAVKSGELHRFDRPLRALLPFADEKSKFDSDCLPMTADDYRELVAITAAATQNPRRSGKLEVPAILTRLSLSESQWITSSLAFRNHYASGDLNLKKIA
jgi:REP element-mobilizing transposase RayT